MSNSCSEGGNGDGIDIDSSKRVRISNCLIGHGGDGIGIKSGYNEDGRRVGIPAEDILISHCHIEGFGTTGLAIGSGPSRE